MMECREYIKTTTLRETLDAMRAAEGSIKLLAGGTDLLVNAREGHPYRNMTIVDIYGLPGLCQIEELDGWIAIGAGVTHAQIEHSCLIRERAGVLSDACRTVGSPQIRNHATIGGNIANASPAADALAALSVLEAEVEINRLGDVRRVPLAEVIEKPYRTTLTDRDLIIRIFLKKPPAGTQFHFYKLGRRKALAISRMTIATLLKRDETGVVEQFHMTMGATFPKPMLFPDIEAMLIGKRPTNADIAAVAEALSAKIPLIAGIRPSTAYKQPVCKKMVERILSELAGGQIK
jgi:CO/xanthine dehydrogenase FAD-binding subunit